MTLAEIEQHYPQCPEAVIYAEHYERYHPELFATARQGGATIDETISRLLELARCGGSMSSCVRCQIQHPSFLVYLRAKLGCM